jgi:hypothetical protein
VSVDDLLANEYFLAPADSYWQWQDRGNVIAWADGTTIAFRGELLAVLKRLETQSLPPFGAIVLLLAACRDSWHEPPSKIFILQGLLSRITTRPDLNTQMLARVGRVLDRISSFSAPLRSSPEAKAEIAATVFEQYTLTITLANHTSQLIRVLEEGLPETALTPHPVMPAAVGLQRDLVHLAAGLDRLDESALELRLQTGLEQQVRPADVALPEVSTARGLVSDLKDDAELGGVARLAQRLMAVVHLPTPLSQPEELPLGGVSDISNRGPLDRLLVSELAQDNLTLAARVANNEALYLRRETPPRVPTRRRLVLLDSGLRMWGVPRVFATAVGLAVAAGASERLEILIYRADGSQLVPVDMNHVEGLNEHLAALDYRVHPGAALAAFAELAAELGQAADLVLVTAEEVLEDPDFRRKLAEAQFAELYLAIVRRDGHFQLLLQTRRGRKRLHAAQLALDEVLNPTLKPTVPLLTPPPAIDLPAIFQAKPFPIRLSAPADAERSWHMGGFGVLTYARDGRLLHWDDHRYGARQLAEGLPPGQLLWAASEIQSPAIGPSIVAVIGPANGNLFVVWLQPDTGVCRVQKLEPFKEQPRSAFFQRGAVVVYSRNTISVYSPQTGEVLCCVPHRAAHVHGRFFKQYDASPAREWRWVTPAFDGRDVHWHCINDKGRPLLTMFEAIGHEGPLGISDDGQIVSLGSGPPRTVRYPESASNFRVEGIARNGNQFVVSMDLRGVPDRTYAMVKLRTLEVTTCRKSDLPRLLELELYDLARPVLLRHRFRGIGVDSAGQLVLVGRHGTFWPLVVDRKAGTLMLPRSPRRDGPVKWHPFVPLECPNRYELAQELYADGSQVLIDSRGLLHLKSSDSKVPECVIVLAEGATAGCTSSGLYWGPDYFWGPPESRRPHWSRLTEHDCGAVQQIIRRFVERLR